MTDYAVYADDSGHPDDQPFVVCAGYIGSESQWLALEPEWKNVLARHNLGALFHMTEFMLKHRNVSERKRILDDLAAVVRNQGLVPVSGAVDVVAYKRVNQELSVQECLGAPYAIAARGMSISVNHWRSNNLKTQDHLSLFTESGTKHRGDMAAVFKRDNLPEPQPVPKATIAVQPADMLAWEIFTCLKKNGVARRRLRRLVEMEPEYHVVFREADLRETCRDAKVIPRSVMAPSKAIYFHSEPKQARRRTIK
jgi:hypothetical protein